MGALHSCHACGLPAPESSGQRINRLATLRAELARLMELERRLPDGPVRDLLASQIDRKQTDLAFAEVA